MDSESSPSRKRWIFVAVLVVLGSVLLAWRYWPKAPPERRVLRTVRFADGSRVDLLSYVVDTKLDDGFDSGPSKGPRTGGFFEPMGGESNGTFSEGPGRTEVSDRHVTGEDRMRGTKAETPHSSLILLVSAFDEKGRPASSGPRAGRWKDAGRDVLSRVEIWTGEQLEWQPMDGPWQAMPTDPRAFCATPIFPRQAAKLRLRFIQTGQPPVDLELDNPKVETATPWQAKDVLPIVKRAGETDVKFSVFPWQRDHSGRWEARPVSVPAAPEDYFQTILNSVEDAYGNMAYNNCAVALPPGNGAWLAKFTVRRGSNYPTPLSEAFIVGDGEFAAVGAPVNFTPSTAFAARYGKVNFQAEARAGGGGGKEATKNTTLILKGTMTGHGKAPDLAGRLRIFAGEKPLPGRTMEGGRGRSTSGSDYEAHFDVSWWGSITPGTKFQLAVEDPGSPVEVEVLFDPPPFPTAAGKAAGESQK